MRSSFDAFVSGDGKPSRDSGVVEIQTLALQSIMDKQVEADKAGEKAADLAAKTAKDQSPQMMRGNTQALQQRC